ncbi:MAG: hypothetical protein DWI48_04960 [Chloroflexi bacterium]|nr:MAG: hypothetical protein DWI48_04960 [Chloroflexota bacterium]
MTAALVLLVTFTIGESPASAQTATATPTATTVSTAPCQSDQVWTNPTGNVVFNAGTAFRVSSVCIQLAGSNSGQIGNGVSPSGCYTVTGVGTASASVTKTSTAASCAATAIYALYTAAPTATATAVATTTATGTPSGGATGTITSGSIPKAAGTFGLAVYGGGTIAQLVTATGCPAATMALWVTINGNFATYVPGTTISAVNADFIAAYPGGTIPANTPLLGRCA